MNKQNPANANIIFDGALDRASAFVKGAESVNRTFAHLAGKQLQAGHGEVMVQYRKNKTNIEDAKKRINNR